MNLRELNVADVNGTAQITINGRTHAIVTGIEGHWWPRAATLCATKAPADGRLYNDEWSAAKDKPFVVDWSKVTCSRCLKMRSK